MASEAAFKEQIKQLYLQSVISRPTNNLENTTNNTTNNTTETPPVDNKDLPCFADFKEMVIEQHSMPNENRKQHITRNVVLDEAFFKWAHGVLKYPKLENTVFRLSFMDSGTLGALWHIYKGVDIPIPGRILRDRNDFIKNYKKCKCGSNTLVENEEMGAVFYGWIKCEICQLDLPKYSYLESK